MGKAELLKKYPNGKLKKIRFKEYNYLFEQNGNTYYIKSLKAHSNTILSINSKYVWEIRYGKAVGINFKTARKERIDMREFQSLPNKIVLLQSKPYKILKYINESEVVDISDVKEIHDVKIIFELEEIDV